MLRPFTLLLAFAAITTAEWESNINYGSPSLRHSPLGVDVAKVKKRMLTKRDGQYQFMQDLKFTHGVASGDPFADSVILWTRISPVVENDASNVTVEGTVPYFSHETEQYIKAAKSPICVDWKVSINHDLSTAPESSGRAFTTSDIDYTVKIEAGGLRPFTTYYYQFIVCGTNNSSPIGRTKTAPAADDDVSAISLAVFSCANFPLGYFNVYGNTARKDSVDYVVHLGDYIYEDEVGVPGEDERAMEPPREIVTLYDYRTRIAQYRTDLDLLHAHQKFPFITVWDDHEIANNNWRDGSSTMNNTEESFNEFGGVSFDQRKMNALSAR